MHRYLLMYVTYGEPYKRAYREKAICMQSFSTAKSLEVCSHVHVIDALTGEILASWTRG